MRGELLSDSTATGVHEQFIQDISIRRSFSIKYKVVLLLNNFPITDFSYFHPEKCVIITIQAQQTYMDIVACSRESYACTAETWDTLPAFTSLTT